MRVSGKDVDSESIAALDSESIAALCMLVWCEAVCSSRGGRGGPTGAARSTLPVTQPRALLADG